ncbi:secreted RxLR effector protein 161-like [Pistacia vera]|uniref:secreted RxLR effector protein 161-like n=1 Tax=Pistacia vera TaxID=55513 RepID=UPI001263ACA0|nr:secreted RxLR effector protein 161-like [Pistacia vera]
MQDSKRGFLPCGHGLHLSKDMSPETDQERQQMRNIPYASIIGTLMYAMLCTRPDISLCYKYASRYQSNLGGTLVAVKTIFKYLRRLRFNTELWRSKLKIQGYPDFDFQSDVDDKKSTFGFIFTCNGGVVSWKSSKQSTTADSTTEAEYIAASEVAKESVWIRKFVAELDVVPNISFR